MNADYLMGIYQLSATCVLFAGVLLTVMFQRWNEPRGVL
jgi:hypothetical protein